MPEILSILTSAAKFVSLLLTQAEDFVFEKCRELGLSGYSFVVPAPSVGTMRMLMDGRC